MSQQRREPPPHALDTADEPRTCYRCGKQEPKRQTHRLLPGSQQIIVCPECA